MSNLSFLDLAFSCRIQKLTHLRLFQTFANEKYYNIRVFTFEILSKIFVEMPKFTVDVSAKQKKTDLYIVLPPVFSFMKKQAVD